jgi:zinc transport system substrate-binding protein
MKTPPASLLCLAAIAATLAGCGSGGDPAPKAFSGEGKPRVFTTNYPVTWLAERVGGDAVEVVLPVSADGDPAFWEPTEADVAAFQSADLILRNGATYEKWADKVSLPESTQVDTSKAFADRFIVIEDTHTHSHGSDGDHSHDGVAFTTWIDLSQAIQQADAIRAAFTSLLPDQAAAFDANFSALRKELEALDADLALAAQTVGDAPLVASHPVYQYLARRYGLNIRSVLWEPETVPDEEAWGELTKILANHPARAMIWEGEPAEESVRKLNEIGVESIVFDPCGNRPDTGSDFISVLRENIANLSQAVSAAP